MDFEQSDRKISKVRGQFLPFPLTELVTWFRENKRDLPWRREVTPYGVWVSEVMLQQTQVAVVSSYYERWMKRFPTLSLLAEADLEEVLKMWEGLGYYSRARHLHQGARYLREYHGGALPQDRGALEKVKGIGPYTAGAILSFAFKKKAAALDGNVLRVMSRYLSLEEDISLGGVRKKIAVYVEEILPDQAPWEAMEGLIELGALVCTKQPRCFECPLRTGCQGLKNQIADLLPVKGKKKKRVCLERDLFVLITKSSCGFEVLLKRGERGQVMADLYEFPYVEKGKEVSFSHLLSRLEKTLPEVKHHFTHFQVTLSPLLFYVEMKEEIPGYKWVALTEVVHLPFSSGHRRVLQFIYEKLSYIQRAPVDGEDKKFGS